MLGKLSYYADYIKAREGFDMVEDPHGFATYKVTGDECYLRDIYVAPEYRQSGIASQLCDVVRFIAKEHGCTRLVGSVQPSVVGSTTSLKAVLGYGFKLHSCQNDFIVLKMDI